MKYSSVRGREVKCWQFSLEQASKVESRGDENKRTAWMDDRWMKDSKASARQKNRMQLIVVELTLISFTKWRGVTVLELHWLRSGDREYERLQDKLSAKASPFDRAVACALMPLSSFQMSSKVCRFTRSRVHGSWVIAVREWTLLDAGVKPKLHPGPMVHRQMVS